jgi:hypothetical protein
MVVATVHAVITAMTTHAQPSRAYSARLMTAVSSTA